MYMCNFIACSFILINNVDHREIKYFDGESTLGNYISLHGGTNFSLNNLLHRLI